MYVTNGLIALLALLFVESTDLSIANRKISFLFLLRCPLTKTAHLFDSYGISICRNLHPLATKRITDGARRDSSIDLEIRIPSLGTPA